MSLSSTPDATATHTSLKESIDSRGADMLPYTPEQCLFCPKHSPSFADSVIHMHRSHGLFVPHQQHLVVDLETLFRYLHLVIYGYRECIQCGTERATVQAVQQHMTGKGHCNFDISDDSEFAEFYNFSEPDDDAESDVEGGSDEEGEEEAAQRSNPRPLLADADSIRLPSGKIISRQSSPQAGPLLTHLRRRTRTVASRLKLSMAEPEDEEEEDGFSKEEHDSAIRDTRLVSRREKREMATLAVQLANMSANDRSALMHLPTSEQRAILATQHRQAEKVQKEESRRRTKIDRKGNKNLYAYWHTETPVYQCG